MKWSNCNCTCRRATVKHEQFQNATKMKNKEFQDATKMNKYNLQGCCAVRHRKVPPALCPDMYAGQQLVPVSVARRRPVESEVSPAGGELEAVGPYLTKLGKSIRPSKSLRTEGDTLLPKVFRIRCLSDRTIRVSLTSPTFSLRFDMQQK